MHDVVHAPEIDLPGLEWLNVSRPLSLEALRGRLVILDFWTFCCINCMHVLPVLKRVEQAFPEEVAVIGVHSPKFQAERSTENLRQALARYRVQHPVVNDPDFRIWRQYAIRAWPTLVFIGPDGRILGQTAGEPDPERTLEVVGSLVAYARKEGSLHATQLPMEPLPAPQGRFAHPAKLKPLPRAGGERHWALADAGHNQIVILDDGGKEVERIGHGDAGFADGAPAQAAFHSPQGLICAEETIFVADTNNHALRRIDLARGLVTTLAGTGARGSALGEVVRAEGLALASPWDLEREGSRLYFANAGTHQLGILDLEQGTVAALAGDSAEAIADGPALAAHLAQPSGLALDPAAGRLYFVDSETSSVRVLERNGDDPARGQVRTLVGKGLFEFGHINGPYREARFQHPLGIALDPAAGRLYVADSYNGVLRTLELSQEVVRDLDDGYACADPLCLPAAEPAGVWFDSPRRLFLVDTNNHRVLAYLPEERTYRTWAS